ncbi:hypothetical protein ACR9E3_32135 [Actinomycetospora sp. C-140]
MLKKAGMVVLGATAGMLSLAPLANAGEAPSHGGDHDNGGHHWQHDGHGHDGHGSRGDCDKTAISSGDRLVSLDNVASNATISHVNVLAEDNSRGGDCDGAGGRKTAISSGDRLISADNLLANPDLSHVNVLSRDNSR